MSPKKTENSKKNEIANFAPKLVFYSFEMISERFGMTSDRFGRKKFRPVKFPKVAEKTENSKKTEFVNFEPKLVLLLV